MRRGDSQARYYLYPYGGKKKTKKPAAEEQTGCLLHLHTVHGRPCSQINSSELCFAVDTLVWVGWRRLKTLGNRSPVMWSARFLERHALFFLNQKHAGDSEALEFCTLEVCVWGGGGGGGVSVVGPEWLLLHTPAHDSYMIHHVRCKSSQPTGGWRRFALTWSDTV